MSKALRGDDFGEVYRAKGFVETESGDVKYFDFTPSFCNMTDMKNAIDKKDLRFIVIGKYLDKEGLSDLLKIAE